MWYGQRARGSSLRARGRQRAEAEGAAAAWRATCTMNFAVSAWQSADAWACEPTKRQVAESAESAAVGMCMVAAVVAAGMLRVSGRFRLCCRRRRAVGGGAHHSAQIQSSRELIEQTHVECLFH